MIRPYCGECGQEMTTCECPEDVRFPLLNMTQEDFDYALDEARYRGQKEMRERISDLKTALQVTARNSFREGYVEGQIEMIKEAAYTCMQRAEEARLRKDHWDGLDEVDYEISYAEVLEAEACASAIRSLEGVGPLSEETDRPQDSVLDEAYQRGYSAARRQAAFLLEDLGDRIGSGYVHRMEMPKGVTP